MRIAGSGRARRNAARQRIDTDAHRHAQARHLLHARPALALDALANALGQAHRLRRIQARGDHHELFAAVAAHQVGAACAVLQRRRHGLDHAVPERVAVAVVDRLEVVDIEHQATQRRAVRARLAQQLGKAVVEGAAVQATGHRVARGQAQQGLVLAFDLALRCRQLAHREHQALIRTVQFGGVVEGGDAAAHLAARVGDGRAVDDQLARLGAAAGELQGMAGVGRTLTHRPRPRVARQVGRQAGRQQRQARQRGAGAQRRRLVHQVPERLVGHHHAAARIDHHHAFGEGIEGALHPVRDHRGRVEMLQRTPHVQAEHERAGRVDEQQGEHQRLGQPAPHRVRIVGTEGDLETAPARPARIQRHPHLVGLGTLGG